MDVAAKVKIPVAKLAIIVLSVTLALCLSVLVGVLIYKGADSGDHSYASSSNNYIGTVDPTEIPEEVPEGEAVALHVRDMLPGDTVTKYIDVTNVRSSDDLLTLRVEVAEGGEKLAEAMKMKVTRMDTGEVVCDGTLAELNGKDYKEKTESTVDKTDKVSYCVQTYLDTSVGNEFTASELSIDLNWEAPGMSAGIAIGTAVMAAAAFGMVLTFVGHTITEKRRGNI